MSPKDLRFLLLPPRLVQNNKLKPQTRPRGIETRTNCSPTRTMNGGSGTLWSSLPPFATDLFSLESVTSRNYAGLLTFMYTTAFDLIVHLEANDTH